MRFHGDVDNSDDVINTRDIEKKIDDLMEEIDDLQKEIDEIKEKIEFNEDCPEDEKYSDKDIDDFNSEIKSKMEIQDDLRNELEPLNDFKSELEGYCDWYGGDTLVRDSYIDKFIRQEIEETNSNLFDSIPSWLEIDWESTIDNLKGDFTCGDWDGITYWVRS